MAESVLVIGGGIIGLSCAWEAAKRGFRVTILEKDTFGGQASGAAAGMLAPFSENTESPDPFFRLCLDSFFLYPSWVHEVEEASGRRVELCRSGSLNVAFHEADLLPMHTRLAWQQTYGVPCEMLSELELRRLEPELSQQAIGALYCPGESHVFAPLLVDALMEVCSKVGVRLIPHAGQLTKLEAGASSGVSVTMTDAGSWHADRVVVCTGAWSGLLEKWFPLTLPVHPIRGQICSFDGTLGDIRHMVFSSQAYWVGKNDGSLVCGASEDVAGFDRSVTERGINRLTKWSGRVFPFLQGSPPQRSWAGLRPATRDGWPLIGCVPGITEVILASGHYRNGILLSPVTAAMVGDLLEGKAESYNNAFRVDRFSRTAERTGSG
ncbi:glycine oxidase ThiO [Cohnella luojiensis]|uniref:glycine oxidase n=1 Tax=Cohnella luojiensis TaxID=652876 RepID=A0A4Y8M4X2_9BACL|nr:glycine oxidase ThiO [Cohnella luojiensis]TFE28101.1 glycine oxidase ThiO [Cohnella luojiensis]